MIKILDTTLREGCQTPGIRMSVQQTLEIAKCIAQLQVDTIECGHPAATNIDFEKVSALVRLDLGIPILGQARANINDIEAVYKTGAPWVGLFIGVNEISLKYKYSNRTIEQIHEIIKESVGYAKSKKLKVKFAIEDTSRTPFDVAIAAYSVAVNEGADRLSFADTLGIYEPSQLANAIKTIKSALPQIPLEMHLHDDRGLAMANSLAGIDAGADWISATINGIGERAGITEMITLLTNLDYRGTRKLPSNIDLQKISKTVSTLTRAIPDTTRPCVGKHIFTHTSKLHVKHIKSNEETYTWLKPEVLGFKTELAGEPLTYDISKYIVNPVKVSDVDLLRFDSLDNNTFNMINNDLLADCRETIFMNEVDDKNQKVLQFTENHCHSIDSTITIYGKEQQAAGLEIEIKIADDKFVVKSPACIFIPAGRNHSFRVVQGKGYVINTISEGSYETTLIKPFENVY